MKNNIAGLHVWKVVVKYRDGWTDQSINLLITTRPNSSAEANRRALVYLRKQRHQFPRALIVKIENEGILDA